jgi:hypothetical protein
VGRALPVIVIFIADVRDRVDQVRDRDRLQALLGYWVGRWEGTTRGNKGGQRGKNGSGRGEDREEPGVVASEQAGLLAKKT